MNDKKRIRNEFCSYVISSDISFQISENLKSISNTTRKIGAFYPLFSNEPNIISIFKGNPFLLPRWSKEKMTFHWWRKGDPLKLGMPLLGEKEESPEIFIIPCVAISLDGYRVGRGGGVYDKILPFYKNSLFIAVASEEQILEDSSFKEAHDIKMDIIVTERGVIYPNNDLSYPKKNLLSIMKL